VTFRVPVSCRALPLVVVVSVLVVSCAPLAPSSRTRGPVTAAPRAADPLNGPWVLRDVGARRRQVAAWRTLLTTQTDTVVRVDTLRGELEVAWGAVPATSPPRVAGLVSDFRAARGEAPLEPPGGLSLPFSFTAEQQSPGAQPTFVIPDGARCDNPMAAAVQPLRDLWMSPPDTLRAGLSWEDSTRHNICRDGVVIAVTTHRRFTATNARMRDGQLVVLVARASRTVLAGRGVQFGDSVFVTGAGEGSATLELSLGGGVIVAGEGTSELRVEFRGSRRAQRVVQESRLSIREP
jgi:hypothetical protein